jgi:hypothetical protein
VVAVPALPAAEPESTVTKLLSSPHAATRPIDGTSAKKAARKGKNFIGRWLPEQSYRVNPLFLTDDMRAGAPLQENGGD